jgi:hypothetical protein
MTPPFPATSQSLLPKGEAKMTMARAQHRWSGLYGIVVATALLIMGGVRGVEAQAKTVAVEPQEGEPVDFAPWCYTYVKGASANPPESRWLPPDPAMLCGLLWESARPLSSLEIEFVQGTGAVPTAEELTAACHSTAKGWPSWWQSPSVNEKMSPVNPGNPSPGKFAFAFPPKACDKAAIRYSGAANPARFTVHVYGKAKWRKPLEIEIEWGVPIEGRKQDNARVDGRIEAYQGYVTHLQPLTAGGVSISGPHQWKETSAASGRRGLRARVWLTDNPAEGYRDQTPYGNRTIVTLWTGAGDVSFAPSDLDSGPILIPSVGVFVNKQGSGVAAAQFVKELASSGKKTVTQRVREHRELNWASAMQAVFPGKALPPIPDPPAGRQPAGMTIDVPEKELNRQWLLSVASMQANTHLQTDGSYMVCIWPKRTALASESFQILRAYDLIGLPQFAEGGLNYWLLSAKPVSPKGNVIKRDTYREHKEGHGRIQATAGFHYRMTRNEEWRKKVLPELEATVEHTRQLRKDWSGQLPEDCWASGLLPPFALSGDLGGHRITYRLDAGFFEGLAEVAYLVSLSQAERGAAMRKEAEAYRLAIRRSMDRAVALTPVMKVQDGTYRRYMPYGPYTRGIWPQYLCVDNGTWKMYHDNLGNGLSVCWRGVYGPQEPAVQETTDIVEDLFMQHGGKSAEPWFDLSGYTNQCGHEPQSFAYVLAGDAPMCIRALYTHYASEILPDRGYHFREHPFTNGYGGDPDKTFEEAAFLERVRMMLVQEAGESLWLARCALREWLEHGKTIAVKNAPTFFGPMAYQIVSAVNDNQITATVELPSRNPAKSVMVRLRHPKAAPIKSVQVNGKTWKDFNANDETIELKGLTGTVAVTASY